MKKYFFKDEIKIWVNIFIAELESRSAIATVTNELLNLFLFLPELLAPHISVIAPLRRPPPSSFTTKYFKSKLINEFSK